MGHSKKRQQAWQDLVERRLPNDLLEEAAAASLLEEERLVRESWGRYVDHLLFREAEFGEPIRRLLARRGGR